MDLGKAATGSSFPFAKMEGTGNDFVLFNAAHAPGDLAEVARRVCDRHTGVGADGILVYDRLEGEPRMRMWNPDGSPSEMCGNGLRCFARWLHARGEIEAESSILTDAGRLSVRVERRVAVGLGLPRGLRAVRLADGRDGVFVSLGNPHVVVFGLEEWERLGPVYERDPLFPERTNVHFVAAESRRRLRVRHWERGAGATLACGTGAGASLVAAARVGLAERSATLALPGGEVSVTWGEDDLWLEGDVATAFQGRFPVGGTLRGEASEDDGEKERGEGSPEHRES